MTPEQTKQQHDQDYDSEREEQRLRWHTERELMLLESEYMRKLAEDEVYKET